MPRRPETHAMSQETELGALGLSRLARRNLVVFGYMVLLGAIIYLAKVVERKDNVIEQDRKELVKCKEDLAAKVEQLMTQANLNGSKGDNILERQSILLDRQARLQESFDRLQSKKR